MSGDERSDGVVADNDQNRRIPVAPDRAIDLPIGVERLVLPPATRALLFGEFDRATVCAALERQGCEHSDVSGSDVLTDAPIVSAFQFVLIGPSEVSGEEGARTVQALKTLSPTVTVLLICPVAQMTAQLLVDAMRVGVSDVLDPDDTISLRTCISKVVEAAASGSDRVLAIGAHPDDVEIGCGGTLLDHRRRGDSVSVLTLSQGDVGGDVSARVHEAVAAASTIGAQLLLGDLPDTRVDPGVDTIRLIEQVVKAVDPTIIYVHSKHDHHQDHRSVHAAVVSASRRVPQVFAFQSPSATNDFAPTKFVAIDDVVVRKVHLLGLFDSQRDRSYLEPEMVVAAARYWARNLAPRARFAEPFEIVRTIRPPLRGSSRPVEDSAPKAPVVEIHPKTTEVSAT